MYYVYLLIFFLFGLHSRVEVDPVVHEHLNQFGSADVLCVFHSDVKDLNSQTRYLSSKYSMGDHVFSRLRQDASYKQKRVIDYLTSHRIPHQSYYIVNVIHIPEADKTTVSFLTSLPEIKSIIENAAYELQRPISEHLDFDMLEARSPLAVEWGIARIGADSLWNQGFKGQGVIIGGEDTGVELHPAIRSNYRGYISDSVLMHNYNWHDAIHTINPLNKDPMPVAANNPCGLDTVAPCDDDNHGTHTMGTMAASDFKTGVAPEAKWIACRCMERGWGTLATYIECFQWFLAPTDVKNKNADPSKAPHVINNSWGCPPEEGCNPTNYEVMEQVIKNLKAAGIMVVASAGNSGSLGCNSIDDPAAMFEPSFTVGASNIGDSITGFSSRGPVTSDGSNRLKPNIVAPGSAVRSTIRNGGFSSTSGTSMSGPHVAGAVALLISAFPNLAGKVELLEDILEQSADQKTFRLLCGTDKETSIPNNTYGYGRLNVVKAYQLAKKRMTTGDKNLRLNAVIHVFPNPSTDYVYFKSLSNYNISSIRLIDVFGRVVYNQKIHSHEVMVNLQSIHRGIVYYQIGFDDKRSTSGKIVIN